MMHKYRAKKTTINGIKFDSKGEAYYFRHLSMLEQRNIVKILAIQPRFILQEGFTTPRGKKVRKIEYVADFKILDLETNEEWIIDYKGMETKEFKMKAKMLLNRYPDINFKTVKGIFPRYEEKIY